MTLPRKWTVEELEIVRIGWEAGKTPLEISEEIPHRTPKTIAACGFRYFKRPKRMNTETISYDIMEKSMRQQDRAYMQALLDAGYTMAQKKSTVNSSGSTR